MKTLKRLFRRWVCIYKGCNARTGSNPECETCKVYDFTVTNCDYD